MNHSYPIYTANTECQDCFKCVRSCPVKAIKVQDGHAQVMPELCIACGHCVEVCPSHAKKIRDDLGRVRQLLTQGNPVYVSLAPSWVSEFRGLSEAKMACALKKLGFAGVSETAHGAETVSAKTAESLGRGAGGLMISSACPVAVDYIRKYLPGFTKSISPVLSPALSHARLLQKRFGEKAQVVFIGPCIAKKNEADRHPDLIAAALLYPTLKDWLEREKINPWGLDPDPDDRFLLGRAYHGALYPIEGGMNKTIRAHGGCGGTHFVTVSGVHTLNQTLSGFDPSEIRDSVFIETLACVGGCVHGPGTAHGSPGLLERLRVIRNADLSRPAEPDETVPIDSVYESDAVGGGAVNLQRVREALRAVGKNRPEDELNCGGCGYDTCRNFAVALIEGKAEPAMCVSWLRQLSQKKSNAMLRCVPAAVVIVDRNLRLIECNRRFAELAGPETLSVFDAVPGMAGSNLTKLIPFGDLFRQTLETGTELKRDMVRMKNRLLSINVFNIDPGQVVGGILFDVTSAEFRRERIASQAREVIRKNLSTVQEIACKLGEHMAETEILLRSIADDYADQKGDELRPAEPD